MGSVISSLNCPHCEGEYTVYEDYNYRTGEWWSVCSQCGETRRHKMARTTEGDLEHTKVLYPMKDCRIAIMSLAPSLKEIDTHVPEELWSMPLSEINGVSEDLLANWINEKWVPDGVNLPQGRHNVFSGDEQLFYIGNRFDVEGDNLVVFKVKWDNSFTAGAGIIVPVYEHHSALIHLDEGCTKEAALKKLEEIRADKDVRNIETANWWNPDTEKLENLLN